jgi:hypothetical protein
VNLSRATPLSAIAARRSAAQRRAKRTRRGQGEYGGAVSDDQVEIFMQEFRQLPPEDQELVIALVARLRGTVTPEFPPDVPFMDFDE